jgi:hypothetical protein
MGGSAMEEHRNEAPSEDRPPHEDTPPPASDHPEPVERRSFFRRSAQVAALSLFGVGGLDPLIDRVAARVAERMGGDRLASEVARRLSESGVMMPRAHAATSTPECPSDFGLMQPLEGPIGPPQQGVEWRCDPQPFHCTQAESFSCDANSNPPFTGCTYPGFACEWVEQFYCQVDGAHFDCDKVEVGNAGFSCPPWVQGTAWFDCPPGENPPAFTCDQYPNEFDCGNLGGAAYLCPSVEQFFACEPPWTCNGSPYGQNCLDTTWECSGIFYCDPGPNPERVFYSCGRRSNPPGTGTFNCNDIFLCVGKASTVDFDCDGQSFKCGDVTGETFECGTQHEFSCWDLNGVQQGGGFFCAGGTFRCSAGGTRCGVGGETGTYNVGGDDDPGDFLCYTPTTGSQGFRCAVKFECSGMADDFRCFDAGAAVFTCSSAFGACGDPNEPYGACSPSANGSFRCNETAGEFRCTGTYGGCPARFANS